MILVGYSAIPSLGGLLDPRWRNWGFYRIWRSPVTGVLCQEVQTNYLSGSKNVWLLAGHWPSSDMVIEKKGRTTETTIEPLKIAWLIVYEMGLILPT